MEIILGEFVVRLRLEVYMVGFDFKIFLQTVDIVVAVARINGNQL